MARPKKPRIYNGIQLEENLYLDNKKRENHYRYLRPDGTFKYFTADTVHQANEAAKLANTKRDEYIPSEKQKQGLTMMGTYIEDFIEYRELDSPELKTTNSWINRKTILRKFGREFTLPFTRFNRGHIESWWSTLSYHQRKARHAEFRKLFNYLLGRNVLKNFEYNPFTTNDDRPRLYLGSKPHRKRQRLNLNDFWTIYHSAGQLEYEGLQIAMGLSLVTFMREQDILALRVDTHAKDDTLQTVIAKSAAQKGFTRADRRQWSKSHKLVQDLIKRGKELSLKNARCPFLVSHRPKRKYKSEKKEHFAQITKERLAEQFRDARDATHRWDHLPTESRPTFHEIRSLADAIAQTAGYDVKQIQHSMAHSDEAMTLMYQANHEMPYEEVGIVFDEEMINGRFLL